MDRVVAIGASEGAAKLSPRQRECLGLVYQRRTSKQIAIQLGIEASTVDGYIADAVRLMGARDRRDAAERMIIAEAGNLPPDYSGGQFPRVDPVPTGSADDRQSAAPPRFRLPFRRSGAAHNDLISIERLFWIPGVAVALAVGFGMLVVGLRTLGDLANGILGAIR